MEAGRNTKVAIGIATYLRPNSLSRLLESLARLEFSKERPDIAVYIVDNDASRSAHATAEAGRAAFPFALHYLVEARRGIPCARNAFVKEALPTSDWLAFIDDDEQAEPCWLDALLQAARTFVADTVAGPVLPRFEQSPPDWVVSGGFYDRPRFATGTSITPTSTGNALVRSTVFRKLPMWFDERHPLMGGEDANFFCRVSRAGFRQVWADNAIIHETVFESRVTLGWLMRRQFRFGNTCTWNLFVMDGPMSAWPKALLWSAARAARAGAAGARSILPGRRGKAQRIVAIRHVAFAAGLLAGLFGTRYPEYRTIHGD